jgi:2-aminobenzoate-CoA ligase
VFEEWTRKTGKPILDGIGSPEMLHTFITNRVDDMAPGTTGKPVTVRGPTGCRCLADARQRACVRDGRNLTGDSFVQDAAGAFHFAAGSDDMIVSAGSNIAGPEVEAALLSGPDVKECTVIGVADAGRGQIVEAHVVLADGLAPDDVTRLRLQN